MPKLRKPPIAAIALGLIAVGIAGLIISGALMDTPIQTTSSSPATGDISVVESENTTGTRSNQGGASLQGAARTHDLIQGKSGNDLQQGSGVQQGTRIDDLLNDKSIQ